MITTLNDINPKSVNYILHKAISLRTKTKKLLRETHRYAMGKSIIYILGLSKIRTENSRLKYNMYSLKANSRKRGKTLSNIHKRNVTTFRSIIIHDKDKAIPLSQLEYSNYDKKWYYNNFGTKLNVKYQEKVSIRLATLLHNR